MITHLTIKNYALISALDIDFNAGLSVITGETGAGKSIILGALGLIKGERADTKSITEGEQKCIVEATFNNLDTNNQRLTSFFETNDLEFQDTCIVRRELYSNGKSRAFINDTPVSLTQLRTLSELLIDIHSQHQNLLLRDDVFQLQIVDAVANNDTALATYTDIYNKFKETEHTLATFRLQAERMKEDRDYTEFQYRQLTEANLQPDEEEQLEQDIEILRHSEDIRNALTAVTNLLDEENTGIIHSLREALTQLKRIDKYLPTEDNISQRIDSSYIELKDIADEIAHLVDQTEYDPERLSRLEERLDMLNHLMQKHHCRTTSELIAICENLKQQLQLSDNCDEEIAKAEQQLKLYAGQMKEAADKLSATRHAVTTPIAQRLQSQLLKLGMPHAKIEIRITTTDDYTPTGKDNVQIYFAANKNQTLRQVADVASGGEIARLMLCIKDLTAQKQGLPTIIFDEVDTGVSGEVADNMGLVMLSLAAERQIIAITHLPQIAVKGTTHYKVYKQDTDTRTETHIRILSDEERINEIATLLSGESVSQAALDNARELLKL